MLRHEWTEYLGIVWADDDEVGKLLGAPFGLSLTTNDIKHILL